MSKSIAKSLNKTAFVPDTFLTIYAATYGYDANDRLTSETYDANGKVTASSGVQRVSQNQLIGSVWPSFYGYDGSMSVRLEQLSIQRGAVRSGPGPLPSESRAITTRRNEGSWFGSANGNRTRI